jgi:hypothetical protein
MSRRKMLTEWWLWRKGTKNRDKKHKRRFKMVDNDCNCGEFRGRELQDKSRFLLPWVLGQQTKALSKEKLILR